MDYPTELQIQHPSANLSTLTLFCALTKAIANVLRQDLQCKAVVVRAHSKLILRWWVCAVSKHRRYLPYWLCIDISAKVTVGWNQMILFQPGYFFINRSWFASNEQGKVTDHSWRERGEEGLAELQGAEAKRTVCGDLWAEFIECLDVKFI
jgi:hypothetical protein